MSKITTFEHLRSSAAASKHFVNGLIGDIVGTVADALDELNAAKADKAVPVAITIPITGWRSDASLADYPNYYDVAVSGIISDDIVYVAIAPESLKTASSCGVCPTCETISGAIRIRAKSVPKAEISAQYWKI